MGVVGIDDTHGEAASCRFDEAEVKRLEAASPRFMSDAPIERTRANLPHWNQGETCVFVTFRLADSIPQEKRIQWEAERDEWVAEHPQPWDEKTSIEYHDLFVGKLELWLDAGFGSCALRDASCREIVEGALRYFDGQRYVLHAFVVMPNHVHVLFAPLVSHTIPAILHSWKSYTATAIRKHIGGSGAFWQKESWDRLIRGEAHFRHVANYIRHNPGKSDIPVYVSEVCARICGWEDNAGKRHLAASKEIRNEAAGSRFSTEEA
jgi:type I restriction enzyme R subunit